MNLIEATAVLNDQARKNMAYTGNVTWGHEISKLSTEKRMALLKAVREYKFIKERSLQREYTRSFGAVYLTADGRITEARHSKIQIANVYFWEILTKEKTSNNTAPFPWDSNSTKRILRIETPTRILFSLPQD